MGWKEVDLDENPIDDNLPPVCGRDLDNCCASCTLHRTIAREIATRLVEKHGRNWPQKLHHKYNPDGRELVLVRLSEEFPELSRWCERR